jgi:hypothetical protein
MNSAARSRTGHPGLRSIDDASTASRSRIKRIVKLERAADEKTKQRRKCVADLAVDQVTGIAAARG